MGLAELIVEDRFGHDRVMKKAAATKLGVTEGVESRGSNASTIENFSNS